MQQIELKAQIEHQPSEGTDCPCKVCVADLALWEKDNMRQIVQPEISHFTQQNTYQVRTRTDGTVEVGIGGQWHGHATNAKELWALLQKDPATTLRAKPLRANRTNQAPTLEEQEAFLLQKHDDEQEIMGDILADLGIDLKNL